MYDMISKHRQDVAKTKRFKQLEKKFLSEGYNREELLHDGKSVSLIKIWNYFRLGQFIYTSTSTNKTVKFPS